MAKTQIRSFQTWPHLSEKRGTLREAFHKPNQGTDLEGSANIQGRPSCNYPRNCQQSGNKYRIGAFQFNKNFVVVKCVGKIHPQGAERTEATPHGNRPGLTGLCKPQPRLYEDHHQ